MTITDTRDMVLVHRVFRREFRLLPLMVRGVADGDALVFLGHILESASPDEESRFLRRRVPPPVRLLYRLIGRRAFTRETAALRAALAAPSRSA